VLGALKARGYSAVAAKKVPMSPFEKDHYINYNRIEDNLKIVRDRSVLSLMFFPCSLLFFLHAEF
jgi:hypothetical protein